MEHNGFFCKIDKLTNPLAFTEIDKFQKSYQRLSRLVNPPAISGFGILQKNVQQLSKIGLSPFSSELQNFQKCTQKITGVINSSIFNLYSDNYKFWKDLQFSNILIKTLGISTISEQPFQKNPLFTNHLSEIQGVLKATNSYLTSISKTSNIFNSFNNSGIFNAISEFSKTISAMTAITKISNILHVIEPFEFAIDVSISGDMLIDKKVITKEYVYELMQELNELHDDSSSSSINIDKTKKTVRFILLSLLWSILMNLFLAPLINDAFYEIREITGINKILNEIDVKRWVDEIYYYFNDNEKKYYHSNDNYYDN
jgi:hypothetical protein